MKPIKHLKRKHYYMHLLDGAPATFIKSGNYLAAGLPCQYSHGPVHLVDSLKEIKREQQHAE